MRDYGKYIVILAAVLAAVLLSGQTASAQTDGVAVISIAGKAEILEQGRRTAAREGQRLLPGQSVRLVGGGEVRLSTTDGRIQVRVLDNTTLKYDGPTGANSLPWTPTSRYQRATSAEEKRVPQMSVPVGRLEVEVQPGQELRLVMPLIMAAVRGTRFTVSVDLDGTSRVNTFDGVVATYGRNGEFRLTLAGQTAEVTARAYTNFLATQGVSAPGGNWKNVPPGTQERVDNSVIGPVFGEGGGDLLVAVLANPNASPTSGVNALAVETATAGTGSLFAESAEGSNLGGGASSGLASQSGSGGVLPDSTLLDQGLPDIKYSYPSSSMHSGPIAHFIRDFALSASPSDIYFNDLAFDLDLGNGRISNAGFYVNYLGPPNASYIMGAEYAIVGRSGSGYLDVNTLHFDITPADNFDTNKSP
jgi:hypothetical protein